ncbi:MAG: hypothetical protein R3F37_02460 [Candidatus Competibacteraceae bacterium]
MANASFWAAAPACAGSTSRRFKATTRWGLTKPFSLLSGFGLFRRGLQVYRWLHTPAEYNQEGAVLAERWQRFSGEKYLILNSEEQLGKHTDDPTYHSSSAWINRR